MNDLLGLTPAKAAGLLVISALLGGFAGLLAILGCHYLLTFGGQDDKDTHGISTVQSTRIGGVLIMIYLILHLVYQASVLGINAFNQSSSALLCGAVPFFLLGLYEDLQGALSARFRFICMLVAAALSMALIPMFNLQPVGVLIIDSVFLANPWVAMLFGIVCLAFLPNAFNTADGANGLVAGLSMITSLALAQISPADIQGFLYSLAVGCALFLMYNLSTGRFFLGDGGAYFLGALMGLSIIVVSNSTDVSVWYLLALIFYPVADLLVSMIRRIAAGRSPFVPDNNHLHNLIYVYLNRSQTYAVQANTLTGLSLTIAFCAIPFGAFQVWGASESSLFWLYIFAVMWLVYGLLWIFLSRHLCVLSENSS